VQQQLVRSARSRAFAGRGRTSRNLGTIALTIMAHGLVLATLGLA
jgi:hypothetical protein